MLKNPHQLFFILLFTISMVIGLTPWGNRLSTQESYPFFSWKLFDTFQEKRVDYLVRFTCPADPDPEKQLNTIDENLCLKTMVSFDRKDFYYGLQNIVKKHRMSKAEYDLTLQRQIENLFSDIKYNQLIVIKRTYQPVEYYFNRRLISYEKFKVFSKL